MPVNPALFAALTGEERTTGHGAFMDTITKSGELITTQALADPSPSAVVRVRGGQRPYLEAKEFPGGFYLVDCDSRARAIELAAMIPDADVDGMGIEVRQVMFSAGPLDE